MRNIFFTMLSWCIVFNATLFPTNLFAQNQKKGVESVKTKTKVAKKKKPERMLKPLDTLYIEVANQSSRYLVHKVKPKQTLYSLAKYYNVTLSDLQFANPKLNTTGLSVGYMLRIPIALPLIKRRKGKKFIKWRSIPVYYKVRPKETLYRLAKYYFRIPTDTLKQRNGLTDSTSTLEINQLLLIGWIDIDGVPAHERKYTGMSAAAYEINKKLKDKFQKQSIGKKLYKQSGMAVWKKKQKGTSLYALHRTAPIGSIVKVTNPLNKRVLYVKVVNRLQKAAQPYYVKIVLSPTAALALGAVDSKFNVDLEYYR